ALRPVPPSRLRDGGGVAGPVGGTYWVKSDISLTSHLFPTPSSVARRGSSVRGLFLNRQERHDAKIRRGATTSVILSGAKNLALAARCPYGRRLDPSRSLRMTWDGLGALGVVSVQESPLFGIFRDVGPGHLTSRCRHRKLPMRDAA